MENLETAGNDDNGRTRSPHETGDLPGSEESSDECPLANNAREHSSAANPAAEQGNTSPDPGTSHPEQDSGNPKPPAAPVPSTAVTAPAPSPIQLQPHGATPGAVEVALGVLQSVWTAGELPPSTAFHVWTRLSPADYYNIDVFSVTCLDKVHAAALSMASPPLPGTASMCPTGVLARAPAPLCRAMKNAISVRLALCELLDHECPPAFIEAISMLTPKPSTEVAAEIAQAMATLFSGWHLSQEVMTELQDRWDEYNASITTIAVDFEALQQVLNSAMASGQQDAIAAAMGGMQRCIGRGVHVYMTLARTMHTVLPPLHHAALLVTHNTRFSDRLQNSVCFVAASKRGELSGQRRQCSWRGR